MPRIPQGQFDTAPSQRISSLKGLIPQAGAGDLLKSVGDITEVAGKIQAKREETEAYNAANDAKRGYELQKANYMIKLENSKADGTYDYIDPTDPKNPTRVKGNLNNDLEDLRNYYIESHNNLKVLNRSDISTQLAKEYIADDIELLNIKTSREIIRKQTKLQENNILFNLDSVFSNIIDLPTQTQDTQLISANIDSVIGKSTREIASVSNSLGEEKVRQILDQRDRKIVNVANDVLDRGISNASIFTAEKLVNKIQNPLVRKNALFKLEETKKTQAGKVDMYSANQAKTLSNNLRSAGFVDDISILKAKEIYGQLKNAYHDPKYSMLSIEEKRNNLDNLGASIIAREVFQNSLDQVNDIQSIEDYVEAQNRVREAEKFLAGRNPAGTNSQQEIADAYADLEAAEVNLTNFLDRSIAASNIKDSIDVSDKFKLYSLASDRLSSMYLSLGDNIASIGAAKAGNSDRPNLYAWIDANKERLKLGYPSYVPKESIAKTAQEMKLGLQKGYRELSNSLDAQLIGSNIDNARSIMIDTTKADKKLQFMIPAADFHAVGNSFRNTLLQDAYLVNTTEKIKANTKSGFITYKQAREIMANNHDEELNVLMQDNVAISGLNEAILNKALAHMITDQETSFKDALDYSKEEFKKHTAVKRNRDKSILLHVVNTQQNKYTDDETLNNIQLGAQRTLRSLGNLDIVEAKKIAVERLGLPQEVVDKLNSEELGFYFTRHFTLSPVPRKINSHYITDRKGDPIFTSKGKLLEFNVDDMLKTLDSEVIKGSWQKHRLRF